MMDQTLLDGLPTGFDWESWQAYFTNIGLPNADTAILSGMNGNGQSSMTGYGGYGGYGV